MLEDCALMMDHAAARGLAMPEWVGNALAKIGAEAAALQRRADEAADDNREARLTDLRRAVTEDLRALTRIHAVLAGVVAPATPASIRAILPTTQGIWKALMGLPLLGFMSLFGVSALAGFTAVNSLPVVSQALGAAAANQLNYLCAAAIGASFYALFTAHRYVVAGTFDPRYNLVYWSRLFLGIIAGAILANFMGEPPATNGTGFPITQTSVALLGGYSAEAVNRILRRLVDMLVTLVKGDVDSMLALREAESKAKLRETVGRARLVTAASLLDLSRQLGARTPTKDVQARLQEIVDELLNNTDDAAESSS
jgi:hypothetical protein